MKILEPNVSTGHSQKKFGSSSSSVFVVAAVAVVAVAAVAVVAVVVLATHTKSKVIKHY